MWSMDLRTLHDKLLEIMPEGATHDPEGCPGCAENGADDNQETRENEGGDMSTTYTQEELDAAIAAAVQPVQDALAELKASQQETEIQERIAKEKEALEARIAEIQAQLDSAVLEATKAKQDHEELVAFLEAAKAEEEAKAAIEARREERLGRVKEVASFPAEYMEANADRWASMDDEAFDALVDDWKAIGAKKEESPILPANTSMVASRHEAPNGSAVREVFKMKLRGIDPRTV